jgi:hypothetical protein
MTNVLLVIGYNNTRIYDVIKIRNIAKEVKNASIVLCKKSPTKEDIDVVDYTIDVDLTQDAKNLNIVLDFLKNHTLNVIGVLPFSDPGTQLGSILSNHFNLKGHNPTKIKAALDKKLFREIENNQENLPNWYQKINSYPIHSFEDLKSLCEKHNNQLFLKPKDIELAWDLTKKYVTQGGLMVEDLIPKFSISNDVIAKEYSFDHVNGYSFITEKNNTKDGFEYEYIVPAPLEKSLEEKLKTAGKFIADLVGYNGSACHNELVLSSQNVIAVEPNIRPAGAKIWDSASIAFKDFDPFKEWILWSCKDINKQNINKNLNLNFYCGVRFFQAPKTGTLSSLIETDQINQMLSQDTFFVDINFSKKIKDTVKHILQDNSDFIGSITLKSKNYPSLKNNLQKVSDFVEKNIVIN